MCGRYSQTQAAAAIAEHFALEGPLPIQPRYNIAPRQPVSVVRATLEMPQRHHTFLQWGLIPSWAKDPAIGNRLINARSETVSEKPSFRAAFKRRRCLVVADGFYEWQPQSDRKAKQPFYIHLRNRSPFAFAGLWEHWQDPSGSELQTCTILTTEPNGLMEPIHNRMPVILEPTDYDAWLDPGYYSPGALQAMLRPFDAEAMACYPVSTAVNRPSNDSVACLEPLADER